ncbi:uncharacterized protein BX664DRAFT_329708 [Halteromyces radiatus]|uniref:uncharacterized protein n=1 Tax=Halteromyces radiatus TaxID=101107 RepID=UPI00221F0AC3|nr:uncharacterized protein BX664DRAFT_329708 [Halteromyces radiatus]KAI8093438.1 hypothetical protein BX664DRAFT_329708 [Halteromyces radiatus]
MKSIIKYSPLSYECTDQSNQQQQKSTTKRVRLKRRVRIMFEDDDSDSATLISDDEEEFDEDNSNNKDDIDIEIEDDDEEEEEEEESDDDDDDDEMDTDYIDTNDEEGNSDIHDNNDNTDDDDDDDDEMDIGALFSDDFGPLQFRDPNDKRFLLGFELRHFELDSELGLDNINLRAEETTPEDVSLNDNLAEGLVNALLNSSSPDDKKKGNAMLRKLKGMEPKPFNQTIKKEMKKNKSTNKQSTSKSNIGNIKKKYVRPTRQRQKGKSHLLQMDSGE